MNYRYTLDIRIPDRAPIRVEVKDKVSIGSSESVNQVITGMDLAPKHCVFKLKNNILSLLNLSGKYTGELGGVPLQHGKMYIVDKGDRIKVGKVEIIIKKDQKTDQTLTGVPVAGLEGIFDKTKEITSPNENLDSLSLDDPPSTPDKDPSISINLTNAKNVNDSISKELDQEIEQTKEQSPTKKIKRPSMRPKNQDNDDMLPGENEIDYEESGNTKSLFMNLFTKVFKRPNLKKDITVNTDITDLEDQDDDDEDIFDEMSKKSKLKTISGKEAHKKRQERLEKYKKPSSKLLRIQKKNLFDPKNMPSVLMRSYAFSCAFILSAFLMPYIPLDFLITPLAAMLPLQMIPAGEIIFKFYINYCLIDIASHFIFGTSLPLFLIGVKEGSSFLSSRIKGLLRATIGAVTTPLLIFDLPLLINKRTTKEIFTKSYLSYRGSLIKILGSVILVPVISLSPLVIPLVENDALKAVSYKKQKVKQKDISQNDGKIINTTYNQLGLQLKGVVDKGYRFLPRFHDKRDGLIFTALKSGDKISINIEKPLGLSSLSRQLTPHKDPLFSFFHKEINQINRKKQENIMVNKEFYNYLKYAMTLGLDKAHLSIHKHGIFYNTPLALRKMILKRYKVKKPYKVRQITNNRLDFLILESRGQIVVLNLYKGLLKAMTLRVTTKSQRHFTKFAKIFLGSLYPKSKRKVEVPSAQSWSSFDILNQLALKSKKDLDDESVTKIHAYFSQLKQALTNTKSEKLFKTTLDKSIDRINKLYGNKPLTAELISGLNNLK